MNDIEVLWLDDDSPELVEGFDGFRVVTAQTCREADELLSSGKIAPDWAIVDLIVPQGGWGGTVKQVPGLSFISHLKRTYGDKIGIMAFSVVMPDRIREKVIEAGALDGIAKSSRSWGSILEELRERANSTGQDEEA